MPSRLNTYISFKDTAREAMQFYQEVFGGDLSVLTFGQFGDPSAGNADGVMHAQLETTSGFTIMASDTPDGMAYSGNPSGITISLSGDDAAELRGYWARLSEGGTVQLPLEKQMWGDEFGQCVDRFGVPWLVNIAGDSDQR